MNPRTLTIPAKTRERLTHPAMPGQRHTQIVQIATALVGQGFNTEAVFWQIRSNYGSDVSDSEIRSVVAWAASRITENGIRKVETRHFPKRYRTCATENGKRPFSASLCTFPQKVKPPFCDGESAFRGNTVLPFFVSWVSSGFSATKTPPFAKVQTANTARGNATAKRPFPVSKNDPVSAIKRYLRGFYCEECDIWERSQIRPSENWESDSIAVIAALFRSNEKVNIVPRFAINAGKAHPFGYGITQNRDAWLAEIARNGPPKSAAGVWMRPNPTDGKGVSDANITAYRFLLIEFDAIPIPLQIAFMARLSLPIAAIITSGGKSVHAWIAVNAANATDYRTLATRIFTALEPFGVDMANRNPARLSRLPGVIREIGTVSGTDNRQRLLYLNPEPKTERIIA